MPIIKVYHNPDFLAYRGDHTDIAPAVRPVATVQAPAGTLPAEALAIAYRRTQHLDQAWWNHDDVMLHVRSTSVGDLLADERGHLFVVERLGFQPYRPQTLHREHRLAEAYRLLDDALAQGSAEQIVAAAGQARSLISRLLAQQ